MRLSKVGKSLLVADCIGALCIDSTAQYRLCDWPLRVRCNVFLEYVGYISQATLCLVTCLARQQFSVCVGNEILSPARACPVQRVDVGVPRVWDLVNSIGRQEFRTAPLSFQIKAD